MQKTIFLFSSFLALSLCGAASDETFEQTVQRFEQAVTARNTKEVLLQHKFLRKKDASRAYKVAQNSPTFIGLILEQPVIPELLSFFAQCFEPTGDIHKALKTCNLDVLKKKRSATSVLHSSSKRVRVQDALASITPDKGNLKEAYETKNMPLLNYLMEKTFENDSECSICFDAKAEQITACCFNSMYCGACIKECKDCPTCRATLQSNIILALSGGTSSASSSISASSSLEDTKEDGVVARMYSFIDRANIERTSEDYTPLMLAAKESDVEVLRMLLKKGYNPNEVNKYRVNALMFAGRYADVATVQALLDIDGIQVNNKDHKGRTALMWAVRDSNGIEKVKKLLGVAGINLNAMDEKGRTALDHVPCGNYEFRILLENAGIKRGPDDDCVIL